MKLDVTKEQLQDLLMTSTRQQVADQFGVKVYVIDNLIKNYNLAARKSSKELLEEYRRLLPKEKLVQLYIEEKKKYRDICLEYNIKSDYLDMLIREYGIGRRSKVKRIQQQYTKEELEDLYFNRNLTIKEMVDRLGTGYLNIRKAFKEYGIQPKGRDLIQKNVEKAILNKYGVKNVRQSEQFKVQSASTKMERYGDPHYHNVEQMNKTVAANGKKYHATDSKPNMEFAEKLDSLGIKYEREFCIGRYRYDFRVDNVLIEVNPYATHNSTWGLNGGSPKSPTYHVDKSKAAKQAGYRCMHMWDWDNLDKVVMMLLPKKKIYARKCEVKEIDQYSANRFLEKYHLQGRAKMQTVCLALYYEGELIQVMTFGKPRFNKNYQWELIRLCTKSENIVLGGSERLYKHFLDKYKPESIISYCDAAKFTGNVYTQLGLSTKSEGCPSRHWYNPQTKLHLTDNGVRFLGFDKLLGKQYGSFGKGTSNDDLLREHGFVEIYDAGQNVYVWNKQLEATIYGCK